MVAQRHYSRVLVQYFDPSLIFLMLSASPLLALLLYFYVNISFRILFSVPQDVLTGVLCAVTLMLHCSSYTTRIA